MSIYFGDIRIQEEVLEFISEHLPVKPLKTLYLEGDFTFDMVNIIFNYEYQYVSELSKLEWKTTMENLENIDELMEKENIFFENGTMYKRKRDDYKLDLIKEFLIWNNSNGEHYLEISDKIQLRYPDIDLDNAMKNIYWGTCEDYSDTLNGRGRDLPLRKTLTEKNCNSSPGKFFDSLLYKLNHVV